MIGLFSAVVLAASFVSALPAVEVRTVASLNSAHFQQAQQRDATATRAFSSVPIKTGNGQCLFVGLLSGDDRANLAPVQVAPCDSSQGQQWDVITHGKHINNDNPGDHVDGEMLVVNALTQACLNFDPRRAAGNQVIMFSCGGRADGGGNVTNSQLFAFSGGAGPQALTPQNQPGSCLVVKGSVVDITACNAADPNQSFTFGSKGVTVATTTTETTTTGSAKAISPVPPTPTATTNSSSAPITTPTPTNTPAGTVAGSNTVISVSRAGGILDPTKAAEANQRDDTATRAFANVTLKSSAGQCLFIDRTAGDFREELIPINLKACDGSLNEKFDFITNGKHINETLAPNSTLIVSSLMNGCLNFDPRRAAGDTVIIFSCGGRADGNGTMTNSQLFTFAGTAHKTLKLQPENANGATCLVPNAAGRLDQAACGADPAQVFTII